MNDHAFSEHDEMKVMLGRKERECEVKSKEKEEVMRTVTMLKGKYEGEVEKRRKAEDELKDAELQKEKLQYNVSGLIF